ncbi:MAG: Wzz/FepE/Etk N-terminal domain-containing protein [Bacteroidetes bacterium]|nr:Wzz/FepE/Etk N-terminal domain-containing protein [Bacteroidota bacterium]
MNETEQQHYEEDTIDIKKYISILWNGKKFIAILTLFATLISAGVSLILPETFKSSVTILPESGGGRMSSLGGLSDLAALAGVNVPSEASLTKLYPSIIKSEAVLQKVILKKYQTKKNKDSLNLIQIWEIEAPTFQKSYEAALKAIREELKVNLDNKTSLLTLEIETEDAQLSADILNYIVGQLDNFIQTKKTSSAGNQRIFVEGRLVEIKVELTIAENKLKDFREQNRMIVTSPELLLQQERLLREVIINTTIYTELKKQFEVAKIEEVKDIPIINVMDKARANANRESPKRRNIVMATFFISLLGAVGLEIFRKTFKGFGFLKN